VSTHPGYYTELVRRLVSADPPLDETERQELQLHLATCLRCSYQHAELLCSLDPQQAGEILAKLDARLTPDVVVPYLRDLARMVRAGRSLSGFQRFLWCFLQRNREAMGRFCLLEADVCLNDTRW